MDIVIKPSFKDTVAKGFHDPAIFCHEILQTDLHDDQLKCLRQMKLKKMTGITCGNRWGKTELIVIYSCFINIYKPIAKKFQHENISTLNTSISQDQANITFDKFIDRYTDKPLFSWLIKDTKKSPFPHVKFKNGVTWWFRNASQNGKYLEGRPYLYINFDEADLQGDFKNFVNEILLPRLWDYGGYFSFTTTPRRGKKNAYKLWDQIKKEIKLGDQSQFAFQGDARNNTFLHKSAISRMNKLPPRLLNRNVKGEYEDSDGEITYNTTQYAKFLATGLEEKPIPKAKYVNVWDFARKRTFNVGITIKIEDPLQLISWERTQGDKQNKDKDYWQRITKQVEKRHHKWRGKTLIDATGLGDVISSYLNIPHVPIILSNNKQDIIDVGLTSLELGEIGLPLDEIHQVINQEYWCLTDELTNFDSNALKIVVWDFICCIFIAIWYIKGYGFKKNNFKKNKQRLCVPKVKGVNKHA